LVGVVDHGGVGDGVVEPVDNKLAVVGLGEGLAEAERRPQGSAAGRGCCARADFTPPPADGVPARAVSGDEVARNDIIESLRGGHAGEIKNGRGGGDAAVDDVGVLQAQPRREHAAVGAAECDDGGAGRVEVGFDLGDEGDEVGEGLFGCEEALRGGGGGKVCGSRGGDTMLGRS
jgi:hypothetical protein